MGRFKFSLLIQIILFIIPISVLSGVDDEFEIETDVQTQNTKRMIYFLKQYESNIDFLYSNGSFAKNRGVEYYESLLAKVPVNKQSLIRVNYADALLNAGKAEDAISEYKGLLSVASKSEYLAHKPDSYYPILYNLALSYFKLGEQQNCIFDHNSESCIYPISSKAVYKFQEPTKIAIKLFKELLDYNSLDLNVRWLLNVSYMNIGIYPDSVPEEYFIPYNKLDSEYKIKKFEDIAPQLGFNLNDVSGSAILDDFDNDNDLDLFVNKSSFQYFVNNGDGTFTERTKEAGLDGYYGGQLMISYQADYNNDGFLDIFISRGGWRRQEGNFPPNSLLKNNGDGTFTDVTIESGLLAFDASFSACWADFDNDGWVDLFVSNESLSGKDHPSILYRNNSNGTFTNIAKESGLAIVGGCKGAVSGDYNNDGKTDLFVLDPNGSNKLFVNNGKSGDGKICFTDVSFQSNITKYQRGISCFFFDYNNDGWLDIYTPAFPSIVSFSIMNSIVGEFLGMQCDSNLFPNLYENDQTGKFNDVSEKLGLNRVSFAMGSNFGDIDNDGFKDIYLGTGSIPLNYVLPNRLFRNNSAHNFQDVTTSSGTGVLQKGHGISFGDIDNDGDQDIYVGLGGAASGDIFKDIVFINPNQDNHWISLKLEGVKSNRSAIGAKIKVEVLESSGKRNIYSTITSGGSFGASTLRAEIGLGKVHKVLSIEVYWPGSNTRQIFKNILPDKFYKIKEDVKSLESIELKAIKFNNPSTEMMRH